MKNCTICEQKLGFLTTPPLKSGKLKDGNIICTDCKNKVGKIDFKISFDLKNYSKSEIEGILNSKFGEIDKIKSEIKKLPIELPEIYLKMKEVKELPKILRKNEKIENIIKGEYNGGIGILVCTIERLIFIDKGLFYGLKVESFPLNKINSIQYETGIMLGKLKIYSSGNTTVIDNVEKVTVRKFAEFVREKIESIEKENSIKPEISVYEKLEKLGKLKENGILTEEEFKIEKQKLLNR